MNAANVAKKLKNLGLPILKVTEGDESLDGEIEIMPLVAVQVPTYGNSLNVVLQSADGKEFSFYPERKARDIDTLVADIRKAMGMTTEEAPKPDPLDDFNYVGSRHHY